jgi:TPR repeat protein
MMRWAQAIAVAAVAGFAAGLPAGAALAQDRPHVSTRGAYAKVIRQAHRGSARAQAFLGFMYANGRGVPQHFGQAAKWYRLAAEQGNGNAQFALGLLYDKGQGVPQNLVEAHKWLNLSAAQAVGEDRDFKVRIRDAIASKMTLAEVELAQYLARAWYPTSFPVQ